MNTQTIVGILLTITATASYINYKFFKLPKSIGITLVALFLSVTATIMGRLGLGVEDFAQTLVYSIGFDEAFLHGMLSFLLFAGSLHINAVELYKHKAVVFVLATISVFISTLLVGYATYGFVQLLSINLPLSYCFLFGALISPTDPIAVLGVLKRVRAPKALSMKIAGEALFNDGMGIVLFFIILGIATGKQQSLEPSEIALTFLRQGGGGILCGAIMGWIASIMFRTVDDYEVIIMLTLAIVTGGYTLASVVLKVSGPICMAVAGLIIGSSMRSDNMSRSNLARLDGFWALLDEVLNAILFVLIGLEFMRISLNAAVVMAAFGSIVITIAARWISIALPVSLMGSFRRFNTEVLVVMTWGGLRGGISIALALSLTGNYHDIVVAITYGVVLFSILVQGLTVSTVVSRIEREKLGVDSHS